MFVTPVIFHNFSVSHCDVVRPHLRRHNTKLRGHLLFFCAGICTPQLQIPDGDYDTDRQTLIIA